MGGSQSHEYILNRFLVHVNTLDQYSVGPIVVATCKYNTFKFPIILFNRKNVYGSVI